MLKLAWSFSFACLVGACAVIATPQQRQAHADTLASAKGWQSQRVAAGRFELVAYLPRHIKPAETLTVYLEGDGFAWISGSTPSADPTPRDPLGLRLALAHPDGNAMYLARVCQFVDAAQAGCAQRFWTGSRFSPEVIDAENQALDILKQQGGATKLVLVGYSGGGNIAALLAARRKDVVRLVTVAGTLDHRAWTNHHRVDALEGSMNAADVAARLAALPQIHFVGGRDRVIPPELARQWPTALIGQQQGNLRVIPDADHVCCWAERWPALISQFR